MGRTRLVVTTSSCFKLQRLSRRNRKAEREETRFTHLRLLANV